jgi:hypothetical protein
LLSLIHVLMLSLVSFGCFNTWAKRKFQPRQAVAENQGSN